MMNKCTKHPKYQAKYAPKNGCVACWKIYAHELEKRCKALSDVNKSLAWMNG